MKTIKQNKTIRIGRAFSLLVTAILFLTMLTNCSKDDEPSYPTEAATLSSISPNSGPKTTIVTINGNHFGDNIDMVRVYFNNMEATVQAVTDTKITTIVPTRAFTGLVKVNVNGRELMGPEFTYIITDIEVSTIAGSTQGDADGTVLNAQFKGPAGITVDNQGNLYIADQTNYRIRKITSSGVVSTFAGSTLGDADGTGINAKFNFPSGVALDSHGNLYVTDLYNNKIRKITPSGVVSTFAGSTPGYEDGTGTNAKFKEPYGIAIDSQNNLYVTDRGDNKIRKITPDGVVSTFAGSTFGDADGTGTSAKFFFPTGITLDKQNNIYITDQGNAKIKKITSSGVVTTIAGSTSGYAEGTGSDAQFKQPIGITIDNQNNLFVADYLNNRIRKITPNGKVTSIAGSTEGYADGTGNNAKFYSPLGICIDPDGNMYISDYDNHKIRKITQE